MVVAVVGVAVAVGLIMVVSKTCANCLSRVQYRKDRTYSLANASSKAQQQIHVLDSTQARANNPVARYHQNLAKHSFSQATRPFRNSLERCSTVMAK